MGSRDPRDYAVVLAIDAKDLSSVERVSAQVGPFVDGIKIGVPPLLANGVSFVRSLKRETEGPIVADLKVADIGLRTVGKKGGNVWEGTNRLIIETVVGAGVDYVICHTVTGTSSIQECVEAAHSCGGKVLTLPYMTHEGAGLFFDHPLDAEYTLRWLEGHGQPATARRLQDLASRKSRGGWRSIRPTISDLVLLLGEDCGVDGYIGPANNPKVLTDYRKVTSKLVFATGVGRQGGDLEEVYKILGSKSAGIIGHSIYAADDPVAAAKEFVKIREKISGASRDRGT